MNHENIAIAAGDRFGGIQGSDVPERLKKPAAFPVMELQGVNHYSDGFATLGLDGMGTVDEG